MASEGVYLSQSRIKKPSGRTYTYWLLQWTDRNGKNHCKSIGSTKKLSKRQAEKLRCQKALELTAYPERRNVAKASTLKDFLKYYFTARTGLMPGTITLHRQTDRTVFAGLLQPYTSY